MRAWWGQALLRSSIFAPDAGGSGWCAPAKQCQGGFARMPRVTGKIAV